MTESQRANIRTELTSAERAREAQLTIDPGFVHKRLIETIIGPSGMQVVDKYVAQLPALPDHQRRLRIDHIYKDVMLLFCEVHGVLTLSATLAGERGLIFCSTEEFLPNERIYELERAESEIRPQGESDFRVILEYSTDLVTSDTLRSRLHMGAELAVIATMERRHENTIYYRPIVMGMPWLRSEDRSWADEAMWWGYDFFEHFVEDFAEFAKVLDEPVPDDVSPMKLVSEAAFKQCLTKILGDSADKDWGGERSDYFTSHLTLGSRRVSGAFLLKGPSRFSPMVLNHLGKNNDQIFRLAQEPADVLFVQHCHDISPPVRATLRAFAVQPGKPRRFCLIDGRDSLRLLRAYGLYDEAVRASA